MAESKSRVAQRAMKRVAVVIAVIASALVVLPAALTPAAALPTFDQGSTAQCQAPTGYAEQRAGGTFRQTFTPGQNQLAVVQLCVTATSPGAVTVAVGTRDASGNARTISTASNTPSGPADGVWLEINVPDVIVTPGRLYELAVTLPAGVAWRGTTSGVDAYAGGASLTAGVGDFGFRTFAEAIPSLYTTVPGYASANTDVRLVEETFNTRPQGQPIGGEIPGVTLSSSAEYDLQVFSSKLFGLYDGTAQSRNWNYQLAFDAPTRSFGFSIGSLDPATGDVDVTITLAGGATEVLHLFDDDNNENTPFWFGYRDASRLVTFVDIEGPLEITGLPAEEFTLDDVTFERDIPRAIAFDRNTGGTNRDIFVMDGNGARPTHVTTAATIDVDPSISEDGSKIAYTCRGPDGRADVCVVDSDGTDPRVITDSNLGGHPQPQFNADPAISPDGSKVAFTSGTYNNGFAVFDIWTVNSDGTSPVELTDVGASDTAGTRDGFATWSPDGTQLAWQRGDENALAADIVRMPAAGGAISVVANSGNNEMRPSWSTAGIAYTNGPLEGTAGVYVADPNASNAVTVLVDEPFSNEIDPAWKPGGSALAFTRNDSIWRIENPGATQTQLTTGFLDANPSWSAAEDAAVSGTTLTASRATAQAGVARVDLAAIPADRLSSIAAGVQSAPVGSIPVGSIPVGSIPVGSIPVGSIDLDAAPVGSIGIQGSPVGSIPVGSIFIRGNPVGSIPVGSIPVGSIPVGSIGLNGTLFSSLGLDDATVDAVLAGTNLDLLRQSVTLANVLADPTAGPRFAALDLRASGLADSLFGSVSLASLLLGAVPINEIPVPSGSTADATPTWCEVLLATTGFSCAAANIDPDQHSFLGAQLAAAPVGSIPVGSIPVGSIPVGSIPVGSIPVGSIAVQGSPVGSIPVGSIAVEGSPVGSIPVGSISVLNSPVGSIPVGLIPVGSILVGSIPVGSIPVGSIPVGSIPVGSIDLAVSPVGSIPVGSIPVGSILLCGQQAQPACPTEGTLADAVNAGLALNPAAILRDLGEALTGFTPAITIDDLGPAGYDAATRLQLWEIVTALAPYNVTLADIRAALDEILLKDIDPTKLGDITLYELLLSLLVRSDFPWESLPVEGMQDFAGIAGNELTYTATATVECPVGQAAELDVDLGDFRYIPGTASIQVQNSAVGGNREPIALPGGGLRWSVPGACQGASQLVRVAFDAHPGLTLGLATSDLTVRAGQAVQSIADAAPVTVTENGEPDVSASRGETPDRLIVGHLASGNDVDTITVPMPTKGSRVRVFLSHVPDGADFDLALAMPSPQPLSTPVGSIPVGSIPIEDGGRGVEGAGALANETLQDIPVGSIPVGSISANRGSEDEVAQIISDGGPAPLTIRVTGYLGSHSDEPYVLRVKVYDPVHLECAPRGVTPPPTRPYMPAPVEGKESLFLVNQHRLGQLYPGQDASLMMTRLQEMAARPEVDGLVVPIDGDAEVNTAFSNWDANPCDIDAANAVVRQINDVVATYRAASGSLRNVVLVGTDEALPFARIPDLTTLSNEQDEAADLAFTLDSGGRANALYAAAAFGYVLSDDAYTAFTSIPWLGRELQLPEVAVARLVETPADVVGQVDQYLQQNGVIDTDTATTFTSGYDFLADGATEVAGNTEAALGANAETARKQRLISETWRKADLTSVLLGADTPTISSVNAHYSHNLLQPAGPADPTSAGGAGFTSTDLLSVGEVRNGIDNPDPQADLPAATLLGRLLFTMGCHAGLNVADTLAPGDPASLDWAQAYGEQRAAVYVANTGYGYGDTVANALSERLMSLFSEELADPWSTLGEKLVQAKHEYFATMGTYGVFDEKVLVEATFYGLPFWRVGPAPTGPRPTIGSGPTTTADAVAGAPVSTVTLSPISSGEVVQQTSARGTYWAAGEDKDVSFSPYRPLQPLLTRDVTVPGNTATGIILKGLATSDVPVGDFARGLPTIDLSANEPEPSANGDIYPANLLHLSTTRPFGTLDQRLVVVAGQSRGDDVGQGGIERLVTQLSADVVYGIGGVTPPVIDLVASQFAPSGSGGNLTFQMRASAADGVKRASVLYKVDDPTSPNAGIWQYAELDGPATPGGLWTKTVSAPNGRVELLGQVQGVKGVVAYSTNKGQFFNAVIADSEPPVVQVAAPISNQVFAVGQLAVADYSCADANGVVVCVGDVADGAVLDTTTPGPRTFTVVAIDRAGNRREVEVPFAVSVAGDTEGPSIAIASPVQGVAYEKGAEVPADYSCSDPSGVASCNGTVADGASIDTSSVGTKAFTVTATDSFGRTSTAPVSYRVVDRSDPAIAITAPVDGAYYFKGQVVRAAYTCSDEPGGTGIASCQGPAASGSPIDTTAKVGLNSFTVKAQDVAGNLTTKTVTYTVYDTFGTRGFFSPVDNLPTLNSVKAGSGVPLKFQLLDPAGQLVADKAALAPTWSTISCSNSATVDAIETTVAAGQSSLSYDVATQSFVYAWKTEKRWAGACRQFRITFASGLSATGTDALTANFKFLK